MYNGVQLGPPQVPPTSPVVHRDQQHNMYAVKTTIYTVVLYFRGSSGTVTPSRQHRVWGPTAPTPAGGGAELAKGRKRVDKIFRLRGHCRNRSFSKVRTKPASHWSCISSG